MVIGTFNRKNPNSADKNVPKKFLKSSKPSLLNVTGTGTKVAEI